MTHPAVDFCSAAVKTEPDSVSFFPFSLQLNVAGMTAYARSSLTSTCRALPSVTAGSVIPFFLLWAPKSVA